MKRILIAISHADEATRLQQALELQGHRTARLEDGGQFLGFCQQHQPDLVIVDVDLPVVNGWAAVHGLRGEESTKAIPAIGLSAHASPMEQQQAQSIGFQHLIAKPMDMDRMLASVEQTLLAGPAPGVGMPSMAEVQPVVEVAAPVSTPDIDGGDGASFEQVHAVAKSIGELVNGLRPHASVLGSDGPEMFSYIEKGEQQISGELGKIEAQGPVATENALYDKDLRHDFRNMIGSVTGFAELILMEAGLDQNLASALRQIRHYSSEFVRLLDAQKAAAAVV
jgi:CheY-like chemotaxis protein